MADPLPNYLRQLIKHLDENQLHALNQLIVERLKLLHKMHTLYAMKDFNFFDRVSFTHKGQKLEGTITRLNQSTITVRLDNGEFWKVSPGALTKMSQDNPLKEVLPPGVWEKIKKKR